MGAMTSEFSSVDQDVATNLRLWREAKKLSQDELAQRMTERGFGFSQATIWKIEQGKRPVKVSEAVALADALGLRSWNNLTADPDTVRHDAQVQTAHNRAGQAYQALKAAAAVYLDAQIAVAVTAYEAQQNGVNVAPLWTSWLPVLGEQAVIEARVEHARQDQIAMALSDATGHILQTLREHGFDPVIDIAAITSDAIAPDAP